MSLIRSGGMARRSCERTTKSASLPGASVPFSLLGVLGEGRVAGEVPQRRLDGEPLRGLPAAGRRALDRGAGDRAGDPPHHLGGEDRPVAAEGLHGARVVDGLEGHGPPGALRAEGRDVDAEVVPVRVGEHRLGGGDDAGRLEARQVGRARHLDVLDPVAAAARAVRARGALEGGEGHVDPPVADRVEHDLPAGLVVGGHRAVELLLRPVREARCRRPGRARTSPPSSPPRRRPRSPSPRPRAGGPWRSAAGARPAGRAPRGSGRARCRGPRRRAGAGRPRAPSTRISSSSSSIPAWCTVVRPQAAAWAIPLRSARSFSWGSSFGTSRPTSSMALSLRTPVGSPFASRTTSPPGGSFVSRVTPGEAQGQRSWPSRCGRRRRRGRPGGPGRAASSCGRDGRPSGNAA